MSRNNKNARPRPKPFKTNYDEDTHRANPHLDENLCPRVEPPQKRYLKESRVKAAIHNLMQRNPGKSYTYFECEQHFHYSEKR